MQVIHIKKSKSFNLHHTAGPAEANFYWSGQPRIFAILVRPKILGPAVVTPPALYSANIYIYIYIIYSMYVCI